MSPIDQEKEFNTTFLSEPKTRRSAIKSIASGMTIAALSGCVSIRKPTRKIKAYNHEPDNLIPGIPNYYATATEINGDVNGLLVNSYEGRPLKIDGNPSHKQNAGKSNQFIQAEIMNLYDPDRLKDHFISKSKASESAIQKKLNKIKKDDAFALVIPNTFSLIDQRLLSRLKGAHPNIQIYCIDHTIKENQIRSIKELTGNYGYAHHNYKPVKFMVGFNHDFLGLESSQLRQSYHFNEAKGLGNFNYISYSDSLTTTDSKADSLVNTSITEQEHTIYYIAKSIARKLPSSPITKQLTSLTYNKNIVNKRNAYKIIQMLRRYKGRSIISAGERHSKNTQKIVLLLNVLLDNINKTVHLKSFAGKDFSLFNSIYSSDNISDLTAKLSQGKINTILSLGVDLTRHISDFSEKAADTQIITLSNYKNRMTALSDVVISQSHFLESWGLLIGKEGDLLIQQPLINPLYGSLSVSDILLQLIGSSSTTFKYIRYLLKQFSINFNTLKSNGVHHKFKYQKKLLITKSKVAVNNVSNETNSLKLSIPLSHTMLDGRYSNNGWLQESPDPISKLTWGNAFQISSEYAKNNQLITGDVISLTTNSNQTIKGPVIILPGQNTDTITIPFGYGQIFEGAFSNYGVSTDLFSPQQVYSIKSIKKLNETVTLADTQMNHGMDEESLAASGIKNRIKNILKIQTIDELHHHDDHSGHKPHSLFKELQYTGKYQWGMSIDLNSCLGCNACSISCQAENNIPIVGKKEVIRGREMSWLRIDRYFIENKNKETTINFMPVACVHCENAPCEQVCPVNATVHDDEGLNVMTYNRCIGTRYCANNCPYKVRRFNFFDWHQKNPQSVKKDRIHLFDYFREPVKTQQMQFNPEVTVRMRGVMEKCTYCIQRLKTAKINSKVKNDESYIKNLQTACQQACTTNSIVFGNINDDTLEVSKKRKDRRRYDLLQYELNTKPRTIFLSKIVNPFFKPKRQKEAHNGYH